MGYKEVTLTFDNLWSETLSKLLVRGDSIDFLARNGDEQVKVVLRGVSDHSIAGDTHTFDTLLTDPDGGHNGHVVATFKPGESKDLLKGTIVYRKYPGDNMSE